MTFKFGDKVKLKAGDTFSNKQAVATICFISGNCVWLGETKTWEWSHSLELAEKGKPVQYEDDWVLVKSGVTVPDDADVVRSQAGHVVAFRPVKKPVVKEYVRWTGDDPRNGTYNFQEPQVKYKLIFTTTDGILTDVRLVK